MVLRGGAFCPGHITGLFSIHDDTEMYLHKGSRGSGVSVTLGASVSTTLYPPEEGSGAENLSLELHVRGVDKFPVNDPIYRQVLKELLPDLGIGWRAAVRSNLQLPVGQGFGMSGAGALATAISVWEALHSTIPRWDRKLRFKGQQEMFFSMKTSEFIVRPIRKRMRSHLQILSQREDSSLPVQPFGKPSGMVEEGGVRPPKRWLKDSEAEKGAGGITYADCVNAAHRADLMAGGGLGDVISQARGGVEIRMSPGVPPYGEIHTIPVELDNTPKVIASTVGPPIETSRVIGNPARRERIHGAGEAALKRLIEAPSISALMSESRQFSIEAGIQSMMVRSALSEVDQMVKASQIMIGNSVFAMVPSKDTDLTKRISEIWGKRGGVYTMDVDLLGARPLN